MKCIYCFNPKTRVTNSRPQKNQLLTWRRRQCLACQRSFTTTEQPRLEQQTTILQLDGTHSTFSLSTLVLSIAKAFGHDTHSAELHALSLAETVEHLLSVNYPMPSSEDIAALTHQVLSRFDSSAAVQYAAQHQMLLI